MTVVDHDTTIDDRGEAEDRADGRADTAVADARSA
jgi:hypothetical protein